MNPPDSPLKDDNSSSFTEGKGSGQTGGARNSGLSAKSGAGSRAPKSAGKGGKGGKKNVVVVSMTPVKLEPEKKKLVKPKKARSAYNFFLEKRIAQASSPVAPPRCSLQLL